MASRTTTAFHRYESRASAGLLGRLREALGPCAARLRQWQEARRSREILSALDDRLLADLGLTRDQIGRVARTGELPGWGRADERRRRR